MNSYRKKPVVIQAAQFTGPADAEAIGAWIGWDKCSVVTTSDNIIIVIPTLEGDMRADLGDWIIRGAQGEFYPCKPDIFAATYEPVDQAGGIDNHA